MFKEYLPFIDLGLSIFQIILIITTVIIASRQFGIQRASSYLERLNSSTIMEARIAVDTWLKNSDSNKKRIELALGDLKLRMQITALCNLFQELGVAYRFRILHRGTVIDNFVYLAPHYWDELYFWIKYVREKDDPILFGRWEYLVKDIEKRKKNKKRN